MKIHVNENEGFIKFTIKDTGSIAIDYGYNIGPASMKMLDGELTEEDMADKITLISLLAGVCTKMKVDMEGFIDIGIDAVDAGFLEDGNNLLSGYENLSEEDLELITMETKGNA